MKFVNVALSISHFVSNLKDIQKHIRNYINLLITLKLKGTRAYLSRTIIFKEPCGSRAAGWSPLHKNINIKLQNRANFFLTVDMLTQVSSG